MDRFETSLEILKVHLPVYLSSTSSDEGVVKVSADMLQKIQEGLAEAEVDLQIPEGLSIDEYRRRLVKVFETIITSQSSTQLSTDQAVEILKEIYKGIPPDIMMPIDPYRPRPPRPPRP